MELQKIETKIHEIRNQKIMFDFYLSEMYGVENRALKQAVKRNMDRFPADFMFQLSKRLSQLVITFLMVLNTARQLLLLLLNKV